MPLTATGSRITYLAFYLPGPEWPHNVFTFHANFQDAVDNCRVMATLDPGYRRDFYVQAWKTANWRNSGPASQPIRIDTEDRSPARQ
jgi:hypothetical protein